MEKVNKEDGRLVTVPPMRHSRSSPSAVVSGGCIVVFGGVGEDHIKLSSCEKFDPIKNR